MNHRERYELALKISRDVSEEMGSNLVSFCLYGSTCRGTDTRWSDLEMFAITIEETPQKSLLIGTVPAIVYTMTDSKLRELLEKPGTQWPLYTGLMKGLVVLSGDMEAPSRYYSLALNVSRERLKEALKENLPGLVFESYGRIFSSLVRKKHEDIYCAVVEVLLEMSTALCLLNGKHVNSSYFEGIRESFEFEKRPARYAALATRLWKSRNPFEIARDARELIKNYIVLLESEGLIE